MICNCILNHSNGRRACRTASIPSSFPLSTPLSSLGKFETSRQLDRKQSTNQFRKVQEIREIQTKHFQFRIPYKMSATSG